MKHFSYRMILPILLILSGLVFSCRPKEQEPKNATLSMTSLSLGIGEKKTISVTGISEKDRVNWSIDKPEVASIDNGVVTAKALGQALITASIEYSGGKNQKLTCQLTVLAGKDTHIQFEDANLKRLILERYPLIDLNKDGELTPEEAKGAKSLMFEFESKDDITSNNKITNLKGLEYFVNLDSLGLKNQYVSDATPIFGLKRLTYLHLGNNNIAMLDVSGMKQLSDLRAYGNSRLKELNLSNNTELRELYLQNVSITRIDLTPLKKLTKALLNRGKLEQIAFSDLPVLERIDIVENNLKGLTANNLPALRELHANKNQIEKVDLKNLPELQRLNLYENKLTQIDLTAFPKIMFLFLFDNNLSQLDLSKQTSLLHLFVSNNPLETLDLSKNSHISSIEAINMPRLKTINLRNQGYNEEAEYFIVEGNNLLEKVLVDSGAEETHVRNLFKNNSKVTIEAQ